MTSVPINVPGGADRCLVMGVVNVTPDSFSDGGKWFGADAAVQHGLDLVNQGGPTSSTWAASPPALARPGCRWTKSWPGSSR
ncbi:hypothetical protein GCM10020001_042730 [Nonomuraea salmonea]